MIAESPKSGEKPQKLAFKPVSSMEIEWGVLIVWLNYCVYIPRLALVEAGHQRWGRRRHSGVQSEWVREGLGAAFGSDEHNFRSEHARENGSNVLKQRPNAAPLTARLFRP